MHQTSPNTDFDEKNVFIDIEGNVNLSVKAIAQNGKSFSSGVLYSNKTYTYGQYSIDAKIPCGNGFYPAFWLFGDGQEIDIFEIGGLNPNDSKGNTNTIFSNIINWNCPKTGTQKAHQILDNSTKMPVDLCKDFHKYTLDWQSNYISISVDGIEIRKIYRY